MKISFTTLACPDWSWERIVQQTAELGYDGIEVRGVQGEMYLPKVRAFQPEHRDQTKRELEKLGLFLIGLGTSCAFHAPEHYEAAIQEGKDSIDLAQSLGVPYIRVFGDKIPDPDHPQDTITAVASGLETLGQYAETRGVTVLWETHGHFSRSDLILDVLSKTMSKAIGILWDIEHTYLQGEAPDYTFEKLGPWIKHCHMKDSKIIDGKPEACLVGDGDIPLLEFIQVLRRNKYDGWLSLEFEKKWIPALEEPEVSLPAFKQYIDKILLL